MHRKIWFFQRLYLIWDGFDPANIRLDWRRLEKVLKSSFIFAFRRLFQNVLLNIFTLVIRLQETSSRRLAKILQGIFKKYHQVKLFLLTRLWDVFKTFLSLSAITVIYGRICRSHFWEIYVQCTKFVSVIKFLFCGNTELL